MHCPKLTPHQAREVAARAYCDPRTVRAYLNGRPQHSTTAARIERAIRELLPGVMNESPSAGTP
jgi:hypothetical protein